MRLHDGKIDKLEVSTEGTFTTDKFSSYMLVYEDGVVSKESQVKKNAVKNKSVRTGVQTSKMMLTGLMGASLVALGAVEVLRRRNK